MPKMRILKKKTKNYRSVVGLRRLGVSIAKKVLNAFYCHQKRTKVTTVNVVP